MLRRGGYPYNHWDGCMCEACDATFTNHNPSRPNIISCNCYGCQKRHTETLNVAARSGQAEIFGMEGISMAGIHICERDGCNAMIKGRALGGITLALSADDRTQPADRIVRAELCPACVEDIYNVLMHAPIGDRQRAYDRPFNPAQTEVQDALTGVSNEQLAAALLTRMMADPEMRKAIGGSAGAGKTGQDSAE